MSCPSKRNTLAWATGMPATPFTTTEAGAHTHNVDRPSVYGSCDDGGCSWQGGGTTTTSSAGAHTHGVIGGDAETRPANAAVLFIIRAQ